MNRDQQEIRAREMIDSTLNRLRERQGRRKIRRVVGGAAVLLALASFVPRLISPLTEEDPVVWVPRLPAVSLVSAVPGEVETSALRFDEPKSLLLVMDEAGVEMRAMSSREISALARKPGCEFAIGTELGFVVRDCGGSTQPVNFVDWF